MGFFDNIANENELSTKIDELKGTLKKKYRQRYLKFLSLQDTVEYRNLEEKVFKDFKSYFKEKGFEVEKSEFVNTNGLTATSGNLHINFDSIGNKQFELRVGNGLDYQTVSIIDVNQKEQIFKGFELDGEIAIRGISNSDNNNPEVYITAIENIEKDIKYYEELKGTQPNLKLLLEEKDIIVKSIIEYLEMLNKELK